MTNEFILNLAIAIASGAGAYAAIRADLATLHERTRHHAEQINHLMQNKDVK